MACTVFCDYRTQVILSEREGERGAYEWRKEEREETERRVFIGLNACHTSVGRKRLCRILFNISGILKAGAPWSLHRKLPHEFIPLQIHRVL